MTWKKINDTKLTDIANAIREQLNTDKTMTVDEMPSLIRDFETGVIPSYWRNYLTDKATEINNTLSTMDNKATFLWYTDAHWTTNYGKSPMILKYLSKHSKINKTFFGGDIAVEKSGEMDILSNWKELVKGIPNHYSVIGNHDNQVSELSTVLEIADFFIGQESDMVIGNNVTNGKMYYYVDNHIEKTRYICLSTGKMWTNADEVSWCIDVLNETPKGWHIIIISHLWLNNDYTNGGVITTPVDYTQGYLNMFDAYNKGEIGTESFTSTPYNFVNAKAKIECIIGGHVHIDYDFTTTGGIPVILTECDAWQERDDNSVAQKDTITENCVYAVVADYDAKLVKVFNVGRGNTRSLTLPNISRYTNQIPISIDSDGTIYNGKGYATNTRLSTSSSAPSTATGWCCTGFIPCKIGDVLRFKNMEFFDISEDGGSTSRTTIIGYKSDFTTNGFNMTWSKTNLPSDAWKVVYGDNGDIIQMTIPTSLNSSQVYIRISCGHIDDNSIITVNEEI